MIESWSLTRAKSSNSTRQASYYAGRAVRSETCAELVPTEEYTRLFLKLIPIKTPHLVVKSIYCLVHGGMDVFVACISVLTRVHLAIMIHWGAVRVAVIFMDHSVASCFAHPPSEQPAFLAWLCAVVAWKMKRWTMWQGLCRLRWRARGCQLLDTLYHVYFRSPSDPPCTQHPPSHPLTLYPQPVLTRSP